MAAPIDNTTPLTSFKALSFDCYGTLIDWEAGLETALSPILTQLPPTHPFATAPRAAVARFDVLATALEAAEPTLLYSASLARAFSDLAEELGVDITEADAARAGAGPGSWAPFADTVAGLRVLKRHYKLIILSNVDTVNITRTVGRLGVEFDAVYTAEEIGSYKPARGNFEYLFAHAKEGLGVDVEKGELLHVARSLPADHVPAKELGLRSVWISRGGDREGGYGVGGDYKELVEGGKTAFEWKFETIGEFAKEVERQFGDK